MLGWINELLKAERKAKEEVAEILIGKILSIRRIQDVKGYWSRNVDGFWMQRMTPIKRSRVVKEIYAINNLNE